MKQQKTTQPCHSCQCEQETEGSVHTPTEEDVCWSDESRSDGRFGINMTAWIHPACAPAAARVMVWGGFSTSLVWFTLPECCCWPCPSLYDLRPAPGLKAQIILDCFLELGNELTVRSHRSQFNRVQSFFVSIKPSKCLVSLRPQAPPKDEDGRKAWMVVWQRG